jgi:hypothetical protein
MRAMRPDVMSSGAKHVLFLVIGSVREKFSNTCIESLDPADA